VPGIAELLCALSKTCWKQRFFSHFHARDTAAGTLSYSPGPMSEHGNSFPLLCPRAEGAVSQGPGLSQAGERESAVVEELQGTL